MLGLPLEQCAVMRIRLVREECHLRNRQLLLRMWAHENNAEGLQQLCSSAGMIRPLTNRQPPLLARIERLPKNHTRSWHRDLTYQRNIYKHDDLKQSAFRGNHTHRAEIDSNARSVTDSST